MAAQVSKLPRGLTALLNIRDQGATPRELADQLVTIIDTLPLYLLDVRELPQVGANLAPVVGANEFTAGGNLTVPTGELWYVWDFTVVSEPGVGAAIDLCPAYRPDGLPIQIPLAPFQAAAAGQQVRVAAHGFWAPAGTILSFIVRSVTLAPQVDGACVVSKLRV